MVLSALGIIGAWVYHIDPFFHYHKPYTNGYYYTLNNQRSQNNGICKHFDYNALITGTSMTENFMTSEMDAIFGTNSVKVPFSGGSYKEINDNLIIALKSNPELKTIIRGLDMERFFDASDTMRTDLGTYPTYLYDNNPFNDVKYLFNKSIIFNRAYPMTQANDKEDFVPGIPSFDVYSNWQSSYTFGLRTVCPDGITLHPSENEIHLTEEDKVLIYENIYKNVTSLAEQYPDVTFYYFFTPYSAAWWKSRVESGTIYRQIEAEQYIIEIILECKNIKLFSFNNRTDITTDLNHYKDTIHYGQWINSLMLKWIHDGQYLLTKDNYKKYLADELSFYTSFDYESLNQQVDYENDFYADALINQELSELNPVNLLEHPEQLTLSKAALITDSYLGQQGLLCEGSLKRESNSPVSVSDYLISTEYIGAKFKVDNIDSYRYLVFYGKKNTDHGQPSVYIFNEQNETVAELTRTYPNLDNEWHQYILDLSEIKGNVTLIFNGGYIDSTGDETSSYTFSEIYLY